MPLAGTDAAEVDRSSLFLLGVCEFGGRRLRIGTVAGRRFRESSAFSVISSCARPSILKSYACGAAQRNPWPARRARGKSVGASPLDGAAGLLALAPLDAAGLFSVPPNALS